MKVGKKYTAIILAGVLSLTCLSGCGEDTGTSPQDSQVVSGEQENLSQQTDEMITGDIEEKKAEPFTMFFTGDVLIRSSTENIYDSEGVSGLFSDDLITEMQGADLCMINQEFPFGVGGTQAPDKQFTFKADPKYVQAFLDMGVDIVSLANNHVLDFGPDVLSQSFVTLDEAGIDYVGAGETKERAKAWASYDLKGTSVAVLSASRVIPVVEWNIDNAQPGLFCTYDPAQLVEQITLAEESHDLTVVFVHWGIEGAAYPEEYQRNMAKMYIDAGADLVVGNHPHCIQGVEYYKGVPIAYSLGNYLFNQNNRPTACVKVHVDENQQLKVQMIPVATSNFKVYASEGSSKAELIDYLTEISFDVAIDEEGYVTPVTTTETAE